MISADIIDQKGPIDILINNAANDTRHKIDDVTEEYWNERMNVNLRHYFFTVQSVKKSMIENKGGVIVNMGSTSWMVGQGGMAMPPCPTIHEVDPILTITPPLFSIIDFLTDCTVKK